MESNITSKPPVPIFPPVTYIIFSEYLLSFICTIISIFNMTRLLYTAKFNKSALKTKGISDSMKLYLTVNVFCGVTTLPYFIYKVFWWRPPFIRGDEPLYSNVLYHFISSIFNALHYGVSSILVFILCLDRCLVLKMGNQLTEKKNGKFIIGGIFVVVAVYLLCGASYAFEFPLNYETDKYCETQSCMQPRLKNYPVLFVKTCFGFANVFCCILFLYLLEKVGGEAKKNWTIELLKLLL
uniref:Uncharacterized protein n=1 Tax=Meloidogyne enterolobii TaxID=390850 RepID=A0A6V7VCK9_MELEN|nr:unnamed protein product [Meloidogyne enterolobii]